MNHTFHIPVLGLGYSIDTPLKVARYGISSVVSIVDDELTERMRKHHAIQTGISYQAIDKREEDSRAKRITAYLNLLDTLVGQQINNLKTSTFTPGSPLTQYFELLPAHSLLRQKYLDMLELPEGTAKKVATAELISHIRPGSIDVNIMSKVDKANYKTNNEYAGDDYTDALAAMRGFANSTLRSSVIISAGLNPRLYAYMERCACFYPDENGRCHKKIILKVSDFRSALLQAKLLAKKGLWVDEFRIESGLNCGGHAFATEGFLLGPILEEFKQKRITLLEELLALYTSALSLKRISILQNPTQRITAQGGIGTAEEHHFLLNYYQIDAAGWGSPFLLVPEATNVDSETLNQLANAGPQDFYISNASPLGVPFNHFTKSSIEVQRQQRIDKGRPGSPCTKKLLCTNTEFTETPICTASREYQHLKILQVQNNGLPEKEYQQQVKDITEKVCLCEGLCASAYIQLDILKPKESKAVSICPGPNLAFFSRKYSLREMVNHIYGKQDLLCGINRPNLFVNELNLYIDYLKKDIAAQLGEFNAKKEKYFNKFRAQLLHGIAYYRELLPYLPSGLSLAEMKQQLIQAELSLTQKS